jgi:putative NIF3 family GTP cyclohydrolase 1 type 2
MAHRNDILTYCNQLLQPQLFKDYCPNGLQVEGRSEIKKNHFWRDRQSRFD